MRILLIATQPFYEDRGTPIAIHETIVVLDELGFEVDLATYPLGSEVDMPGLEIFRTANPFNYRSVRVGFSFPKMVLDICLLATVLRLLTRKQYDCIHGVEEGAGIALLCKRLFGIPAIYDMQSSLPEQLREVRWFKVGPGRWLSLALERWLVRNADCIIASCGLARHVHSIEPGKAVSECCFKGLAPRRKNAALAKSLGVFGHPTIVYTGNFAPYQGLDVILEAAVMVLAEFPRVRFVLVGGTNAAIIHYAQLVKKRKLEDSVKLIPRCPRQEIPDFLALADVLVLPRTRGANVPLKIYDYLQSGIPIVATDIPAHRAILTEKTAFLTEPNARGLSRAVIHALRDPAYANKLSLAAAASIQADQLKTLRESIYESYQIVAKAFAGCDT